MEITDRFRVWQISSRSTPLVCSCYSVRRAFAADFSDIRQDYIKQAMLLSRTYAQLLETLTKKRNIGNQKITVQHLNVEGGDQAIVGNVSKGGGEG